MTPGGGSSVMITQVHTQIFLMEILSHKIPCYLAKTAKPQKPQKRVTQTMQLMIILPADGLDI